jgi:imidazolonepropionase-like amidohydrolase
MPSFFKKITLFALVLCSFAAYAQPTFPQNGIYDSRESYFALTNATVFTNFNTKIENATLVIRKGVVESVTANGAVPQGAAAVNCKGKTIYPSWIDAMSSYGLPEIKPDGASGQRPQLYSTKKGAFAWNEALRSEFRAAENFTVNNDAAKEMRELGFGAVLTHRADGISRGSAAVVALGNERENMELLKSEAAHFLSFKKGNSAQDYPSSLMGSIALLRQTYLDGRWYTSLSPSKGGKTDATTKRTVPPPSGEMVGVEANLSLAAWNNLQTLPQFFDVRDWQEALRAAKVGEEFGVNYIMKGNGTEYQRIEDMKKMNTSFIIPLNFPAALDVEDPYDALQAPLSDMKHWELAPRNAMFLAKAQIPFAFTLSDLKDKKEFWKNLRKAVKMGLSKEDALRALTATPAAMLKMDDRLGSLEVGKIANFVVTSGDIFEDKTTVLENWVRGKGFVINKIIANDIRGTYRLSVDNQAFTMDVGGSIEKPEMKVALNDTTKANVTYKISEQNISLYFAPSAKEPKTISLSGTISDANDLWKGNGTRTDGAWAAWQAVRTKGFEEKIEKDKDGKEIKKEDKKAERDSIYGAVCYPFMAFGNETLPTVETILIRNATVWTNEKQGILKNTDVLIKDGKIADIGKNLSLPKGATEIDGTDKHLTAGIIDEHSHIAISRGVNEGTQESTAEVRIGDVVSSEDINIYRQLAGGVVASQLLHGSANPIGGQSALIKLRWGYTYEQMKIAGADGFIKFALGENVKQANWGDNATVRYPQTRMGVEQVFRDYFARAKAYDADKSPTKRRDLDLETVAEILNKKRFITCHSYVQSEILMLMKVAEDFGFRVNTFTHILEGYKVAKQMKAHGVYASTFADWWAYKMEVQEAIPYNGAILHEQGVTVGFNSDDAEMGRRLNQEAAKAVEFGGVSEEEAWKFVTLNPAKMLHLDGEMGSIKKGKSADIVLWSKNPLSVYARAEYTFIDGIKFFDRKQDAQKQQALAAERNRLVQKLVKEKQGGAPTQPVNVKKQHLYECDDVEEE